MELQGVLCIDKPQGFTSFDVVAKMRGIAKTRKVGHGGTLDPMATGVLPIFLGRATKACDLVPEQKKRYLATFRLGITTDTQDITGQILRQEQAACSPEQVRTVLARFVGQQQQVPPMYSAVKVDGKRLYDLARQGKEVQRQSREITIFALELLDQNPDAGEYTIDVTCSKGTYIRTLCHDVGQALGCGATLTQLRRTLSAGFSLERCITLEEASRLAEEGRLSERVLPVEQIFAVLPRVTLTQQQTRLFCNGAPLDLNRVEDAPGTGALLRVCGADGRFLGLAQEDLTQGLLMMKKLFALEGERV